MTETNISGVPVSTHLTPISKMCDLGGCPTLYRTDRDTLVVQGWTLQGPDVGIDLPPGEQLVEIPAELLTAIVESGVKLNTTE